MIKYLLTIFLFLSACATIEPAAGVILTNHIGYEEEYNDVHPFVSASIPITEKTNAVGSVYYNSEYKTSVAAGIQHDFTKRLYVSAYGATGYKALPIMPLGYVGYRLTDNIDLMAITEGGGKFVIGTILYWKKRN